MFIRPAYHVANSDTLTPAQCLCITWQMQPSAIYSYYCDASNGPDGLGRFNSDSPAMYAWASVDVLFAGALLLAKFLDSPDLPVAKHSPTERYAGIIVDEVVSAEDTCAFTL